MRSAQPIYWRRPPGRRRPWSRHRPCESRSDVGAGHGSGASQAIRAGHAVRGAQAMGSGSGAGHRSRQAVRSAQVGTGHRVGWSAHTIWSAKALGAARDAYCAPLTRRSGPLGSISGTRHSTVARAPLGSCLRAALAPLWHSHRARAGLTPAARRRRAPRLRGGVRVASGDGLLVELALVTSSVCRRVGYRYQAR